MFGILATLDACLQKLMKHDLTVLINQIVNFVVSKVSPQRIVLFGSCARGENTDDSDIDILVLMKNIGNERVITKQLYRGLLNEDIESPVDFIVADYDKYHLLKDRIGYIYRTIEHEGKIIYDR